MIEHMFYKFWQLYRPGTRVAGVINESLEALLLVNLIIKEYK